ncbi:hypothetical protein L8X52_06950 [Campylobacter lari]|nr:hypothetical protein [Campylobacter lari]MCV3501360.1 hypothetical protein [Campylobacter lari]
MMVGFHFKVSKNVKRKNNTAIEHARALALINKECLELIDYMEECDEDELRSNLDDLKNS